MTAFENLLAYENQIEKAWIVILQKAGQENVYQEHSDENKATPFIEVQLTQLEALERRHIIYKDRQVWAQPYDMFKARLISRAVTYRGHNSEKQWEMLARIRLEAMAFSDRFSSALLPYHQVVSSLEKGLTRGFDDKTSLDWSEVIHEIIFWIRPDAWPPDTP